MKLAWVHMSIYTESIIRTDLFGRAWHLKGAGIIRLPGRRHDAPGRLLTVPY